MVKFIKKYYHLTIFIGVFAWAGCGAVDVAPKNELETAAAKNDTQPVDLGLDNALKEEKNQNILQEGKRKGERQLTLTDGSQYIEMKDAYGNKIEYRYFESDAPIKYISLETLDDGTLTMFVKPQNGARRPVDPSVIDNPWKSNAREIAARAGIYENLKLNNNQSISGAPPQRSKATNRTIKNNPPPTAAAVVPAEPKNAQPATRETIGSLKPE
jgi:hypothetical protein